MQNRLMTLLYHEHFFLVQNRITSFSVFWSISLKKKKSILNTLHLSSLTITLVWIPIWASFLWLKHDDSYLKLEVKYWKNTRHLADLKNGTKLECEKEEIILMDQSDR